MKRYMHVAFAALFLALLLGIGGAAQAQMMGGQGMMRGGGWGRGGSALTAEQQAAAQKIYTEHYQATFKLRQLLYAKHSELNALLYNQSTDDKKIKSLTKEIGDLDAKLLEDRVNMRRQLIKAGVPAMGMMGGGRGMGYGGMMGGGMGYGGMVDDDD